ncbi:MAG TPA: outer membrane protein assembly factor BamE [Rhodocyclaceae bacterium]|nr:outer membrane protein assembly factor BamE [Rhodocyclaceae bacterium]
MLRAVIVCLSLGGLALGGCATPEAQLSAAGTTRADVVRVLGEPKETWKLADGGELLLYPTGPLGTRTYRAEIAQDGRVREFAQTLNERGFSRLRIGATEEEVRKLYGKPALVTPFDRRQETGWDYRYVDQWGYPAVFHVVFDASRLVKQTMTVRIDGD